MAEQSALEMRLPAAPRRGPYHPAILLAALMFAVDQLSKSIVAYWLALPRRGVIALLPSFDLRWEQNRGVSMSYLSATDETGRWLLVVFTGAICAGVGVWLWRERRRDIATALGLVLGGALGNVVDRINHGFVVDFADLHLGEWRPFSIFNLADVMISVGVALLLGISLLSAKPR